MATKLKGLEVGKVDFVDEGANQRADQVMIDGRVSMRERHGIKASQKGAANE